MTAFYEILTRNKYNIIKDVKRNLTYSGSIYYENIFYEDAFGVLFAIISGFRC